MNDPERAKLIEELRKQYGYSPLGERDGRGRVAEPYWNDCIAAALTELDERGRRIEALEAEVKRLTEIIDAQAARITRLVTATREAEAKLTLGGWIVSGKSAEAARRILRDALEGE